MYGRPLDETTRPRGRPLGSKNRTTIEFQQGLKNLLDYAAPKMVEWLQAIAKDDPVRALELFHKYAQFAFPTLSRQTVAGDKDNPVELSLALRLDAAAQKIHSSTVTIEHESTKNLDQNAIMGIENMTPIQQ
jgi:hypothetical protein